jgi:hypothetical protein
MAEQEAGTAHNGILDFIFHNSKSTKTGVVGGGRDPLMKRYPTA